MEKKQVCISECQCGEKKEASWWKCLGCETKKWELQRMRQLSLRAKVLNLSDIQLNTEGYLAQYGREWGLMNGQWSGNHKSQRHHRGSLSCIICVNNISSTTMEKKEGNKCSEVREIYSHQSFPVSSGTYNKAPHRVTEERSSLFSPHWHFPTGQQHHDAKAVL